MEETKSKSLSQVENFRLEKLLHNGKFAFEVCFRKIKCQATFFDCEFGKQISYGCDNFLEFAGIYII